MPSYSLLFPVPSLQMSSSPAKRSADGNLPRRVAKAARSYVATAEDRGDELNRETLLKRNRCFVQASNKELQAFVQEKENPPANGSSVGGPYYQYANAVAEYIRNMRETEKRYGGETGAIICFGNNEGFQQGRGDEEKANEQSADDRLPRQYIWGSLSKKMIRQVAAGGMHAAVLTDDGQVFTWGTGDDGALGRGRLPQEVDGDDAPAVHQATATAVKGFLTKDGIQEDGKICQVSAGASHVHFLSFAGNVYMTGMYKDNDSGKFHMPRPGQSCRGGTFTPNHIWELPSPIVMICSGGNFGAAITQERSLLTWGLGNCGELSRSGDNKGHDLIYDQVYSKETKKMVYNLMSHNYKNDEGQYEQKKKLMKM
jgi:alpha-tubulin suppressor-like RCC1 family protein